MTNVPKKSIIFQLDASLKVKAEEKLKDIGISMSEFLRRTLQNLSTTDVSDISSKINGITATPDVDTD
jgi:hypothetical protein